MYNDELMCEIKDLCYSFARRAGHLYMAEHNSCDMQGCIALFKRVDPNVQDIATFAGGESDTRYKLTDRGWQAVTAR